MTARRAPGGRGPREWIDAALEASVVGSFSRVGYAVRRHVSRWDPPPHLDGRLVAVTGASSGIGRAAAVGLARLGADVWLVGRDHGRLEAAAADARATGGGAVHSAVLDITDASAVEHWCGRMASDHDRLGGLVHCAGALLRRYGTTAEGIERTVATHVLAPYRLTWLLSPLLRAAGRDEWAAVVTMTSGGMYTVPFDLDQLEGSPAEYDGVRAYARAKRAQVVLAAEWARRWSADSVASYSTHPGWVATPGLERGLPGFDRLARPILRRPVEGADTAVWLAAGGARPATGGLWLDRHLRSEHRLARTRHAPGDGDVSPSGSGDVAADPGAADGRALWDWCAARTGVGGREGNGPHPGQ